MSAEMFQIDLEPESQIWPGQPLAVCSNPGGRFHGWLFQQHPDGQWVSIRKLRPENLPLATGTSLLAAAPIKSGRD